MEDDAKKFLMRVGKTLSAAFLWLLINVFIGIYMGWMFFYDKPTTGNYVFYSWMLITIVALLFYFRKVWGRDIHGRGNPD